MPGRALLRVFVVVLVAYTATALLAWKSFGATLGPAFFYPPAGLTVAALILTRRTLWPATIAAIVVGESALDLMLGHGAALTIGFCLADTVEPLVGAVLVLTWCGGQPDLSRRRDHSLFIAGACLLGPATGGLIGGTATALYFGQEWSFGVLTWWAGDALGVLVTGTPILLWERQSRIIRDRPAEAGLLVALTAGLTVAALQFGVPATVLVLPVIAVTAFRLNMMGAALAGAAFAFMTNVMTSRGRSIFGPTDLTPGGTVAVTQLYVGVTVAVALLFAQEAAARMRAVREHRSERRERLRLEALSQLAQRLAAAMDIDDIGRALRDHMLNEVGAKAVSLGLLDAEGTRLDWVVVEGYSTEAVTALGSSVAIEQPMVATESVRTGEPVLIKSAAEYRLRYGEGVRLMVVSRARSVVSWPLQGDGRTVGTLVLTWSEPQVLDRAQVAYISTVAAMVGQALARARVYADDRERAAVLQSALLPGNPGEVGGLDVQVCYEPADLSGGIGSDWYDVMTLPGGRIYLSVGDVKGRGPAFIENMAQLRSAGRALAHQGLPPSRLLSELSGLTRSSGHGATTSMAVVICDPESGTASYCTAGHPPAVLRRAATGEVVELVDADGPALGAAEASYVDRTIQVDQRDILVMYTDGLTGALEGSGAGRPRPQLAIADWRDDRTLRESCEELHRQLAPRPREEDLCVLAVRFGPASG